VDTYKDKKIKQVSY